jgi:hypothetical protein
LEVKAFSRAIQGNRIWKNRVEFYVWGNNPKEEKKNEKAPC